MPGAALLLVVGAVLLAVASDHFVRGAERLAMAMRVSQVVVGAVVVGFGTSTPEFLVAVVGALRDARDVAIGSVVGSNTANVTLVLGTAALVHPMRVSRLTLRREVLLSAAAVASFAGILRLSPTRVWAAAALATLVGATALLVRAAAANDPPHPVVDVVSRRRPAGSVRARIEAARTLGGLAGTLLGAQLVVHGAARIAVEADLPEAFVGFTVVAVGTSLPELVTALQAVRHGHADLVVGNVLGSNLFNSLGVAPAALLARPGTVASELSGAGLAGMLAACLVGYGAMATRRGVGRAEATLLVAVYLASAVALG